MGLYYEFTITVTTHSKPEMATVVGVVKTALAPLKGNSTIWEFSGQTREVQTPDMVDITL